MTKTALITGATSGFGRAAAKTFIDAGWQVIATGRRADRLQILRDELGDRLHPAAFDIRDEAAMRAALDGLPERFRGIDLLVNNAGLVEPEVPLWEADPDRWWQVMVTNVRGPFLVSRAVIPHMIEAGGGRIVNLNSGAGTREDGDLTAYTASKSALARITGGIAAAGERHGVFAFDMAPGVVRTDMTGAMQAHVGRTEWTSPEEVTDLVLGLASGELDAWSGRFVRAGADTVDSLRGQAESLGDRDRTLGLVPYAPTDPLS